MGAMSVYWHFKSKEGLLQAMRAEAFLRLDARLPALSGLSWEEDLRRFFSDFHTILRNDDVLCDLTIMRRGPLPDNTMSLIATWGTELSEILIGAGFAAVSAMHALAGLDVHTRGCLFIERSARQQRTDSSYAQNRRKLLSDFPLLASTSRPPGGEPYTSSAMNRAAFDFGLENSLNGLRAQLAIDRKLARSSRRTA